MIYSSQIFRKLVSVNFLLAWLFFAPVKSTLANNINVSNLSLTGKNTSAGNNNTANYVLVQFNLSWENSWRTSAAPSNYDAAWVFIKFKVGASNPVFTGVSSSGTTVTVSSTSNLRAGMPVRITSGTGSITSGTVIQSITNSTQFVLSSTPTVTLSGATIECSTIWEHAWLNNSGHSAPSGSTIDAGLRTPDSSFHLSTNPAVGAFVYRSSNGTGSNNFSGIQLRWNYGAQGVKDSAIIYVKVFSIEMVRINSGSFRVGDGSIIGTDNVEGHFRNLSSNTTYQITSEAAITLGTDLYNNHNYNIYTDDDYDGYTSKTLPAAFPKGTTAFYCMKYEITQKQYVDFLNTLTRTQQANRVGTPISQGITSISKTYVMSGTSTIQYRNSIRCSNLIPAYSSVTFFCDFNGNGIPNESDDGLGIACNYLTWFDIAAFLDWASLRPMTELEYEKICRGPTTPVRNEMAWGTTSSTQATGLSNVGSASENPSNSGANLISATLAAPIRVGAMATSSTTRTTSGAGYYGCMELSGNLNEHCISTGSSYGRAYTGIPGDGTLSSTGFTNESTWPGIENNQASAASGQRGDSFDVGSSQHRHQVSNRYEVNAGNYVRQNRDSARGVRE